MKNVKLILFPVIVISIIGCSKEKVLEPKTINTESSKEFIPLSVGNYWIYETYQIDTFGNETLLTNQVDSYYVDYEISVGGVSYYKISSNTSSSLPKLLTGFLRNGEYGILNYDFSLNKENYIFNIENMGTIISTDTINYQHVIYYSLSVFVNEVLSLKTTDLGNFLCYDEETILTPLDPNDPLGTRSYHKYVNKGVGIIAKSDLYHSVPTIVERRLIRYYLN